MIFKFNHLTYDVPEGVGISIEVEVSNNCVDFNFVKDGDHIPMLGGIDEHDNSIESWEDVGIKRIA